jgi:hypothetical protein
LFIDKLQNVFLPKEIEIENISYNGQVQKCGRAKPEKRTPTLHILSTSPAHKQK